MSAGVTEDDILCALAHRYQPPEWAFVTHLRAGTGYTTDYRDYIVDYESRRPYRNRWERIMDAWAINCYPSTKLTRVAFEVKVNRSDFLRELQQPWKRQAAMDLSNLFYFAAPVMVAMAHEIPKRCGLIEVNNDGSSVVTKKATHRDGESVPLRFVASLARKASRMEDTDGNN